MFLDSIAKFSEKSQDVLNYNPEKLFEVFPELAGYGAAGYVTVPEFNSIATITMASGIIGSIAIYKRFS